MSGQTSCIACILKWRDEKLAKTMYDTRLELSTALTVQSTPIYIFPKKASIILCALYNLNNIQIYVGGWSKNWKLFKLKNEQTCSLQLSDSVCLLASRVRQAIHGTFVRKGIMCIVCRIGFPDKVRNNFYYVLWGFDDTVCVKRMTVNKPLIFNGIGPITSPR